MHRHLTRSERKISDALFTGTAGVSPAARNLKSTCGRTRLYREAPAGETPGSQCPTSQILFNLPDNLPNLKRSALNFRERHRIDQILRPDHCAQLAQIHFGNNHGLEPSQYFTKIPGEWIQVT